MSRPAKITIVGEDRASKQINDVAKSMEHATARGAAFGTIAGQAFGNVAGKVVGFAKESIDAFATVGSETAKLQRYIGGTVEDASRLRFAAQESGVGFDDLTKGMGKFEKTFVGAGSQFNEFENKVKDAAEHHKKFNGHLGSSATAFAKLGISVKDAQGNLLPMQTVLPEIAEQFKSMPNGAEKTAMALQLFGKGGMALLPMLNKGAEGMKELAAESDKFGTTLSAKDTAAVKANIMAKRQWHAAIEGVQIQLGRYLYPALTQIANAMVKVIPQIQKFAGPIMKSLGAVLTTAILPALKEFFTVLTGQILPAVTTFGDWVGKHKTLVMTLATSIGTVVVALKAWAIYQAVVVKVTAAWATVQALLNGELVANPIGLVVVAIAALAAGLIYAYNHSKTFRDVVNGAFKAVSDGASFMWNRVLKPTFKFIVDAYLAVAGAIVHGAASAFGWIPGIGGKLKAAAKAFDAFKNSVNKALGGIQDKTINLHIATGGNGRIIQGRGGKFAVDVAPAGTVIGGHHPALAAGGIVTARPGGMLVRVGEGGQDEAVIPLSRMRGSGTSLVVNVNAPIYGAGGIRQFAEEIRRTLADANSRGQHLGLV